MFLFAVPVMEGFGIYFVPLVSRHAQRRVPATERLWIFLHFLAAAFCCSRACFSTSGPDAGWFAYVPLSARNIRRANGSICGRR